jgi:hypothetical protein
VNITKAGVFVQAIDLSAWTNAPNGLAYDAANDAFYVLDVVTSTLYRVSKAGATLATFTGFTSSPDSITTDPLGRNWIWYTTNTHLRVYDLNSGGNIYGAAFTNLNQGEGLAFKSSTDLWVCHDGYFHTGTPTENQLQRYTVNPFSPIVQATEINLFFVATVGTVASPTDCIFQFGNPLSANGVGVYLPSTAAFRVFVFGGASVSADFSATVTSRQRVRVQVNPVAETISLWLNEVQVGSAVSISGMSGGLGYLGLPVLGAAVDLARHADVDLEAVIATTGALSSEQLAACWAALPA